MGSFRFSTVTIRKTGTESEIMYYIDLQMDSFAWDTELPSIQSMCGIFKLYTLLALICLALGGQNNFDILALRAGKKRRAKGGRVN